MYIIFDTVFSYTMTYSICSHFISQLINKRMIIISFFNPCSLFCKLLCMYVVDRTDMHFEESGIQDGLVVVQEEVYIVL